MDVVFDACMVSHVVVYTGNDLIHQDLPSRLLTPQPTQLGERIAILDSHFPLPMAGGGGSR